MKWPWNRKPLKAEGVQLGRLVSGYPHGSVVYFLRVDGWVKIGTSENLMSRIHSLSLKLADVLLTVPGGREVETALHDRFADYRIYPDREWFRLEGALADFLVDSQFVPKPTVIPEQAGPPLWSLRDASQDLGEGVVPVNYEALKKARTEDPGFPEGRPGAGGTRGRTPRVYTDHELREWHGARGRETAGTSSRTTEV